MGRKKGYSAKRRAAAMTRFEKGRERIDVCLFLSYSLGNYINRKPLINTLVGKGIFCRE